MICLASHLFRDICIDSSLALAITNNIAIKIVIYKLIKFIGFPPTNYFLIFCCIKYLQNLTAYFNFQLFSWPEIFQNTAFKEEKTSLGMFN
jgi:hypothetical protein